MNHPQTDSAEKLSLLDKIAIFGSFVCLVHCLALPLIVAALPFLGSSELLGHEQEQIITMAVLSLCLIAILPGYFKHKRKHVLLLLAGGLFFFLFATFAADQLFGEGSEVIASIPGSICMVFATLRNRSLSGCSHSLRAEHSH